GVLHHTADPDKGLAEITRVLKPGGHLWLYLYGSGGLYWHVMYWIRGILSGVDLQQCILLLRLMGAPIRRIAEWIDDWFVPYLRAYTAEDVTSRLRELGYDNAEVLRRGVHYDTSQRRVDASSIEMDLMGQGDLRFFCTKVGAPKGALHKLPDPPGGRGSSYAEKPAVLQVDKPLARIESGLGKLQASGAFDARTCKILVSRAVHEKVRDLLESEGPADVPGFLTHLSALGDLLDGMTHLPGRRA
ncbi:MAG: methyltransferase domain-containing protein, partial [Phycisphaerae bacterium]|nr:methyltransferase domain-containing protein [Phycisphaerae bacterium]